MKIIFINHNGGSIYHGPNLRTFYASKALIDYGHDVNIVSSSYSHKYNTLPIIREEITKENIDGVSFFWIRCIKYKNIVQRVFSHFQFAFKLLINRKKISGEADLIIFSGPPPEIFFFVLALSKFYRCKVVSDVRDLWPKTQIEMSKIHYLNPYTYLLYFAQWAMVNYSSALVTPLPGAYRYFNKINSNKEVHTIENGFSFSEEKNLAPDFLQVTACSENIPFCNSNMVTLDNLRTLDRFVVGYSGAFDRDNDLDSIMSAVCSFSTRDDVVFLFLGDGKRKNEIVHLAQKFPNVVVLSRVDSRFVPSILGVMDICYCGLKSKSIYQYGVSLAKSYEYMAAGKPILWMIDAYNNPVEKSSCGFSVLPGDVGGLVQLINKASTLPKDELEEMGARGYDYLCKNHCYDVLGRQWNSLAERFSK